MSYVAMFCSNCGKRFINPCVDDCASLCESCRKSTALNNEINDRFSEEEIKKIMRGPVSDILNPDAPDNIDTEDEVDDNYFDDDTTFEDDSDLFDLAGDLDEDLVEQEDD